MKFSLALTSTLLLGSAFAVVVPVKPVAPAPPKAPTVPEVAQGVKDVVDVVCNALGCITTTSKSTMKATATATTTPIVRLGARAVVPVAPKPVVPPPAPKPVVPAPKPVAPAPKPKVEPVEMVNLVKDVVELVCNASDECATTTFKTTTRVPKSTSTKKTARLATPTTKAKTTSIVRLGA